MKIVQKVELCSDHKITRVVDLIMINFKENIRIR